MCGKTEINRQNDSSKWFSRRTLVCRSESVDHMPYCNVGYRPPKQPIAYYVASVFHLTNETLNFWTHFFPLIYFLHKYVSRFVSDNYHVEMYMIPHYVFGFVICMILLVSCLAHMFNAASSELHRCCFAADNSWIYIHSFAFKVVGECYLCELEHFCQWPFTLFSHRLFGVYLVFFFWTYLYLKRSSAKLLSAVVLIIGGTIAGSPCIVRYYYAIDPRPDHISYFGEFASEIFPLGCFCSMFTGLVYAFKIPERFSPDTFAYVGNSHQIMHVLAAFLMYLHCSLIETFLERLKFNLEKGVVPDSALNSNLWMESLVGVLLIWGLHLIGILVDWKMSKSKENKKIS